MVGHHHIAHQQESIRSPNSAELLDEHIPCPRCCEQGQPPVATEGHKMKLTLPVVALQSPRHSAKFPPSNTEGGAPSPSPHYTPMKCSSGILSSHAAVKRKRKPAPGPPVCARAGEIANPGWSAECWRILGADERPEAGDVAAFPLTGGGTAFSGHSGFITSDGNISAHGDGVYQTPNQFAPTVPGIVFRRYICD